MKNIYDTRTCSKSCLYSGEQLQIVDWGDGEGGGGGGRLNSGPFLYRKYKCAGKESNVSSSS